VDRTPRVRVLLIGIDAYTVKPLRGCVNDIDSVQKLLLERFGVPAESITRLASPHADAIHKSRIAQSPATYSNIRAALVALGSDEVDSTDRVFIFYSGHGGRVPVTSSQGTSHRESLVPVDFNANPAQLRLLIDFEFNGLLAAIAERTRSVTVVLDCCHAMGATRDLLLGDGANARGLEFAEDVRDGLPLVIESRFAHAIDRTHGIGSVDDCQVVAACLNHELAQEDWDKDGVCHGLLTRAFVGLLGQVDDDELRTVTWGRIWQRMRDRVETANPSQHVSMSGSYARPVLGGPPVDGDAGFPLKKAGPNEYLIDAGTLADVDVGARLAVYGPEPAFFPDLGSHEDEKARLSKALLKVVRAQRAWAIARCEAEPFELPHGSRARLVANAPVTRLRFAVVRENAGLVEALGKSDLLQLVEAREAEVRLEQRSDGTWALTDDVAGTHPDFPALVTLRPDQLDLARPLLELYARYAMPLRMATRCIDLPGQLQMSLLRCPTEGLSKADGQVAELPEVQRHPVLGYAMEIGTRFCVQVRNAAGHQLRVTLLNCAASGRIEFLGEQSIDPRYYHRFWSRNTDGVPFVASPVPGARTSIDRLVVIGTTRLGTDLRHLGSGARFSDILTLTRDFGREVDGGNAFVPVEKWTATQVLLGIGLPKNSRL
jgi:hypothetical protein